MLMIKTKLRQLREELSPKVSQEAVARQANLSLQWYRQLESGQALHTSYSTAQNILAAINAERSSRNLEVLKLDELDLKIV